MVAIRLDIETEQRLDALAAKTHRTKTFYIKEAIKNYLDDLEDIYIANQRLEDLKAGRDELVSLENVKKELGL